MGICIERCGDCGPVTALQESGLDIKQINLLASQALGGVPAYCPGKPPRAAGGWEPCAANARRELRGLALGAAAVKNASEIESKV